METLISCKNLSADTYGLFPALHLSSQKVRCKRFSSTISKTSPVYFRSRKHCCQISCMAEIESRESDRQMFIFGMGFVGQYLADQLKNKGWRVSGTCTSEEKKMNLKEKGYKAFTFKSEDMIGELTLAGSGALHNATHVISSVPPCVGCRKDPVLFELGDVIEKAISNGNIRWMGYLSSTGVYGHWQGDWVDEDSPAKSVDDKSLARLDAEKAWIILGKSTGVRTQIFRLGGIYGPGRSALDTIIKQKKLSRSQKTRGLHCYTSRVHVADICQAILASIENPSSGKIYNIVDDDPASRAEVFSYAMSLLKKKWPDENWESMEDGTLLGDLSRDVTSYMNISEKRVSNKRLKDELQVKLLYPSYKMGLECIIKNMDRDSQLK